MNRKRHNHESLPPTGFTRTAAARRDHGKGIIQSCLSLGIIQTLFVLLSSAAQALILGDEVSSTQSEKTTGDWKVLAIAVRFPDATPSFDPCNIKRRAIDNIFQYAGEQSFAIPGSEPATSRPRITRCRLDWESTRLFPLKKWFTTFLSSRITSWSMIDHYNRNGRAEINLQF